MKIRFSQSQLELLQMMGFPFDYRKDLTDFEYFLTVEHVGERILKDGFDDSYQPTEAGRLYSGIMEQLCEIS
jgi:hypothetical protein